MSTPAPRGFILYEGPSVLDGGPVVVVAVTATKNTKTGAMVQTYILRADTDPLSANKTGLDYSICGTCPRRGAPTADPDRKTAAGRSCYVVLAQGPLGVFKAYRAGKYGRATTRTARRAAGAGRQVRLGTYGDPAAVPSYVWRDLLADATGHTGYTHQPARRGATVDVCMVSADSLRDAAAAWLAGRRTFRVVDSVAELDPTREVLCPASKEAGYRTTCAHCGLCAGSRVQAKSIAIVVHGSGARHN